MKPATSPAPIVSSAPGNLETALRTHWPEYLMEAGGLGLFMLSACAFTVLIEHPASFVRQAIGSDFLRRVLMGVAMAATSITLVCSPWGQRSGAHMNPALTLTFLMLGKVKPWDACFYAMFQFLGGLGGVLLARLVIGEPLAHARVHYAATVPGALGVWAAFAAEVLISFVLVTVILRTSNSRRFSRYTPFAAGLLVATYITFEAPISGMSMNPARTLGSAASAMTWDTLWVYFTAPLIGMSLAALLFAGQRGLKSVFCAKLHHHNSQRCIFRCNYGELMTRQ